MCGWRGPEVGWWLTAPTGYAVCPWGLPGSSTYLLLKILLSQAEFSTAICVLLVFTFLQKWTVETKKMKGPIICLHFTPKQNKKSFSNFFFYRKQHSFYISSFS